MPHSTTNSAIKLSNQSLQQIAQHQSKPQIPTYERTNVKEGIVHVGVGGFHRSHLAVYVDAMLNKGAKGWSIAGVGLQPFDAGMRDALNPQDGLYSVIERGESGSKVQVVGAITSYLFAPDNNEALIAKMAHPDTHIVSMTITESGYYYNENTHELQSDHPDIVADVKAVGSPKTTFGYLYAALERRYQQGLKPFTVLSCDNMQKNGSISRHMLVSFAKLRDPKVAEWIANEGAFPNSMVDRITPRTADVDKTNLARDFGIEDAWPVVTEPFMQWVIEDKFCDGRPPFEKVGVQVVDNVHDVEQFEMHKLRLLNASHSAMAYAGHLAGFTYVHEVINNPLFNKLVRQMMHEEVKPLLPAIAGVDIDEYCKTLLERFSNPTIMDEVQRVALNGSGKIPQFIMPSIAENIWRRGPLKRLAFTAAAWFRYVRCTDEKGVKFVNDDPMAEQLYELAVKGGDNPMELLNIKNLFGDDLRTDKIFIEELTKSLKGINKDGVMATLEKVVD